MKAYLKRLHDDGKATTGVFFFHSNDSEVINLASLELPWKDNMTKISCIPKGTYEVVTTYSNRFKKDMWQVLNVPNRTGIRIHSANFSRELLGCIALGMERKDIDGDGIMDIATSKDAIKLAEQYLGKEFELEIL